MGWTVVEPLSPGIFQIDPSIYDDVEYSAETRVFNVPIVGQGIKQIIKSLTKKLSAKVSAQVTEQVTKQVGKAVTEKAGTKNAIEQASKDAIPEAFEKVMREKNPAYMKWLDEGMEGTRPALKVSGDSLDNAIAKEAADTATKKVVAKETGEEVSYIPIRNKNPIKDSLPDQSIDNCIEEIAKGSLIKGKKTSVKVGVLKLWI